MARRRRRNNAMNKPTGAFAGSMSGGRSLGWESLAVDFNFDTLDVMFPSVAAVVAGRTRRFVSLLPANVTRGVVTLERLHMQNNYAIDVQNFNGAVNGEKIYIPANIQLVPVQDGSISLDSVLSPRNAADQESNRLLWRHTFEALGQISAGVQIDGALTWQCRPPSEFDVKTKRRFDRALWALIYVVEYETIGEVRVNGYLDIRALFRTSDGL